MEHLTPPTSQKQEERCASAPPKRIQSPFDYLNAVPLVRARSDSFVLPNLTQREGIASTIQFIFTEATLESSFSFRDSNGSAPACLGKRNWTLETQIGTSVEIFLMTKSQTGERPPSSRKVHTFVVSSNLIVKIDTNKKGKLVFDVSKKGN